MPFKKHVWEFMDASVDTISEDADLAEAVERFRQQESSGTSCRVLIVDGDRKQFRGVICVRDILKRMKSVFDSSCRPGDDLDVENVSRHCRLESKRRVREVMHANVCISPSASIMEAFDKFVGRDLPGLPVVDGNRPIGVLTVDGLFRAVRGLVKNP